MKVAVVGGGVVGLLSAWELIARGATVTLFDDHRVPASWAGGGILSPLFPWRYPRAMTALTVDAMQRYRSVLASLDDGAQEEIIQAGGMWTEVAGDETKLARAWARRWGVACRQTDLSDFFAGGGERPGVLFPDVGNIRNPRLLKRLKRALHANTGVACVRERVTRVEPARQGAAVITRTGKSAFDRVLICAGAWSQSLLEQLGARLPLFPAKGEMLLFKTAPGTIPGVVLTERGYLIPRRDGLVLAGSTLRKHDGTTYPTVTARYQLTGLWRELVPALAKARPVAHWAGIRPGCDRDYPYLGPLPGQPAIFAAVGHYRNGLVAAPASAQLLAQMISGEPPFTDPSPYAFPASSRSSSSFLSR